MAVTTLAGIFVVALVLASGLSFALGRLAERIAWNALIEKGLLPKPKSRLTT